MITMSMVKAALKLRADQLPPDCQTVEVTVVPVRGKARTFTFSRSESLNTLPDALHAEPAGDVGRKDG